MTVTPIRPQRFYQCDETCTVECGHCKGSGIKAPTHPTVAAILALAAIRGTDLATEADHDVILDGLFPTHADEIRNIASMLADAEDYDCGRRDHETKTVAAADARVAELRASALLSAQFVASLIAAGAA